jgi:hypothetical protein
MTESRQFAGRLFPPASVFCDQLSPQVYRI